MTRSLVSILSSRIAPPGVSRREAGATAIEYAMMIVMVALVILASTALLGGKTADWFTQMSVSL